MSIQTRILNLLKEDPDYPEDMESNYDQDYEDAKAEYEYERYQDERLEKLSNLAHDFYNYTTTISITEDELFSNLEAENPDLKNYDYNEMVEYETNRMEDDMLHNPKAIQTQLENDLAVYYYPEDPEVQDIIKIYKKLKDADVQINIPKLNDLIQEIERTS